MSSIFGGGGGGASSIKGWLFSLVKTAPNNVIPVAVARAWDGVSLNNQVDIALVPSGVLSSSTTVGAISVEVPDGTVAGGNKRGISAVDLQLWRNAADQVASGLSSFAAGSANKVTGFVAAAIGDANTVTNSESVAVGNNNTVSGQASVALAQGNTVSGGQSVAAGNDNTVSGNFSVALGKLNNVAANQAVALGNNNSITSGGVSGLAAGDTNTVSGAHSFALGNANIVSGADSGVIGTAATDRGIAVAFIQGLALAGGGSGQRQRGHYILANATSGAAPTVLTADGGAASAVNQVALPSGANGALGASYAFEGKVVATDTATQNTTAWVFNGAIKQAATAASTALVANVASNPLGASGIAIISQSAGMVASGIAIALAADTTNGALQVTATGIAATNIEWMCEVTTVEATY